jgi:DNA-binding CsgD family transcriptional regulator
MDEVVNLCLQGLTLREIGDKMGITLGKVDWLLKAANKKG